MSFLADNPKEGKESWTIAWKTDWQPSYHETSVKNVDKKEVPEKSNKDSTYSWIVMAVAFVSNFMSIGFSYAIGVYFAEFRYIFGSNAGTTSLVSALNFGMICLSGK